LKGERIALLRLEHAPPQIHHHASAIRVLHLAVVQAATHHLR
jgi:hypothetical protein